MKSTGRATKSTGRSCLFQRSELAHRTGCNAETVRYYEKIGLMPDPPRSASGYRCYDHSHVQRLAFILRARKLGFALEVIGSLLELIDSGSQTCAEVAERTERHLEDVRSRIKDLRRIEKVLAATLAECPKKKVPECPMLDALMSPH